MLPLRSGLLAEVISLYKISAWIDNPDFIDQTWPKKVFPIQNRKSEHHHFILHIRISLGIKFHLKMTTLIFWTKCPPTEYFRSEHTKWAAPLNSPYLTFFGYQISASTDSCNFLNQIELSFLEHWILHIRIVLGAKFQLQLAILIFWTKSAISGL